jgi:cytoskeletal protein RodZ
MQIDIIDAALISLGALYVWWVKGYFAQQIQTAPTQKVALDAPQPETPPTDTVETIDKQSTLEALQKQQSIQSDHIIDLTNTLNGGVAVGKSLELCGEISIARIEFLGLSNCIERIKSL